MQTLVIYCSCHLLFCCMFVDHAVNKINQVWQQISCTQVVRTGQNLHIDRFGLAAHQSQDW